MLESAARFVPCADEVFRLQRGNGGECRHFQAMADQGHYGRGGGTRQGIYVFAPSGKLLASANTLKAEHVLNLLDEGFAAWEALPASMRRLAPSDLLIPEARWEDSYPSDGLALRGTVRDLGKAGEPLAPGARMNVDFAWFSAEEARSLLPVKPRVGATQRAPREMLVRFAALHLVDNVRGQTIPFAPDEITEAELNTRVLARDGDHVRLALTGHTRAESDGIWRLGDSDWGTDAELPRSIDVEWRGEADFDLRTQRFTRFDLLVFGEREGRGTVNGRHDDPGPSRLGWVFRLGDDSPAERIAPTFADHYDVPWVTRPATAGAHLWLAPSELIDAPIGG
ncbi:MAG: hypothetical protein DHS20C15_06310 [Planctomycetota bacterium]|nr:MAG: hypothetical protein DHS20C15_06310 [Planctomycetota bacterium]